MYIQSIFLFGVLSNSLLTEINCLVFFVVICYNELIKEQSELGSWDTLRAHNKSKTFNL